jgi:hypothetical protein
MGDISSLFIQTIFAGLLVAVTLSFIINFALVPSMTSYGNEHATYIANSLGIIINGISLEDEGTVNKDLGLPWDIEILKKDDKNYITVTHNKFESKDVIIVADIEEKSIENAIGVVLVKRPGESVKILTYDEYNSDFGDQVDESEENGDSVS